VKSDATTAAEYLRTLPLDVRKELARVRAVIKKHLPKGYAETMSYGVISYVVPLKRYPAGYLNKKDVPLPYVSLGAQKRYLALYLMNVYGDPKLEKAFRRAWRNSGKKLDMGKSCVRFQTAEDLALDAVAEAVASTPVDDFIERYETARKPRARKRWS
jgi:hypothetical protein